MSMEFSFLKRSGPLLLIFLTAISCTTDPYFPPPEEHGGWRKSTDPDFIRSLGIDPDRLEEFGKYSLSVPNNEWKPYADFKGTLVIKNGWIIGEWYNTPEAKTFKTYLSSNGKAFAMACFGIMAQDSKSGGIDVEISEQSRVYDDRWLAEGFPLSDPQKEDITFEQIFRHTSGLCPERTGTGESVEEGRNEWTDYSKWILGQDTRWPQTGKIFFPPDEPASWQGKETWGEYAGGYSSVGFGHIGLVLRNVYGTPASQFLWERLLEPIGFSDIDYHAPPSEKLKWFSAGGLRMSPRDYARFAYFLLNDGNWGGEQLVPSSWIQRFRLSSRYPNIRSNVDGFFGRYPKSMFRIAGSGLNWAFMVPELDLIVLRTGRSSNRLWGEVEQTFLEKVFAALEPTESELAFPEPGRHEVVANPSQPSWLQRRNGSPFFMAGAGDPEDFLFRGQLNPDGTRNGDQMELISKMGGTGANSIYLMAVRSHGGDGEETHNPCIDFEPSKGVNQAVLNQWDRWFNLLDRSGIVIYFILFDDGARFAGRRAPISDEERAFIRALVERFQHHRNLIWCVAEEYEEGFTPDQAREVAREIRSADQFGHPIAVHKLSGTDFSEFSDEPTIDQFAMQLGKVGEEPLDAKELHRQVVEAWKAARGRFNLNMSELAGHYQPGDRDNARLRSWAAAMGGAYVMVLGMDIENTEPEALADLGNLARFFETTEFSRLQPHDDLVLADTEYLLAAPGESYIAYASQQKGQMGVKGLSEGPFRLSWFDCVSGDLTTGQVEMGSPNQVWDVPSHLGPEVALYITRLEDDSSGGRNP